MARITKHTTRRCLCFEAPDEEAAAHLAFDRARRLDIMCGLSSSPAERITVIGHSHCIREIDASGFWLSFLNWITGGQRYIRSWVVEVAIDYEIEQKEPPLAAFDSRSFR